MYKKKIICKKIDLIFIFKDVAANFEEDISQKCKIKLSWVGSSAQL